MRHLCLFYVVSNSVLVNGRVSQFCYVVNLDTTKPPKSFPPSFTAHVESPTSLGLYHGIIVDGNPL